MTIDDANDSATRDLDYTASLNSLVIPGGQTTGTQTITITPTANDGKDANKEEEIILGSSEKPKVEDEDGVEVELTVESVKIKLIDTHEAGATPSTPPDPTKLAFADTVAAQTYTVGTAITDLVLPEATGGTGVI